MDKRPKPQLQAHHVQNKPQPPKDQASHILTQLNNARGKRVVAITKDSSEINEVAGLLKAWDQHLNLVLENAEMRDNPSNPFLSVGGPILIPGRTIKYIKLP